jgi:hypothetical protein
MLKGHTEAVTALAYNSSASQVPLLLPPTCSVLCCSRHSLSLKLPGPLFSAAFCWARHA